VPKKAFASGCFDLLHSGHIAFFQEAAAYGELYVAVGSDRTVFELKGRLPVNSERERTYMVQAVGCVKKAFVSRGTGLMDFVEELSEIRPEYFIVNEDGNTPQKRVLCEKLGIQYVVLKREPHAGLQVRSTTALRTVATMPYRVDLAGGWLDQPWVSTLYPGAVITVSLEPTIDFNERSGMASSTRRSAIDLWGARLPPGDAEKLAKMLFCWDNPPGTKEVSGSQDAIGIVMPGANYSYYEGKYWPSRIESILDESVLNFIEESLYLIPLGQRESGFTVLADTRIDREGAQRLSEPADACWKAIANKDLPAFGKSVRLSFEAQISMFPNMLTALVLQMVHRYKDKALGWKISGAGGGGYLILVSDRPVEDAVRVEVRRRDHAESRTV
jgi:cytidyltransferase-like protein